MKFFLFCCKRVVNCCFQTCLFPVFLLLAISNLCKQGQECKILRENNSEYIKSTGGFSGAFLRTGVPDQAGLGSIMFVLGIIIKANITQSQNE
jgi:hypothetical protein